MSESESRTLTTTFAPAGNSKPIQIIGPPRLRIKTTGQNATQPKKRSRSTPLQARFARIRQLPGPKTITFEDYCLRASRTQPPVLPRPEWIRKGCPSTFPLARKESGWRRKIYDEWIYVHPKRKK